MCPDPGLDWDIDFANSCDPPQEQAVSHTLPSFDPISRPLLPFAEFSHDKSDGTNRESEPQQDSHALDYQEARPGLHIATVDWDHSHRNSPRPDPVQPVAENNPFSYGYGHGRATSPASSSTSIPIQLSPPSHLLGSSLGIAKVMASKDTTHPSPVSRPATSRKRFSAPLPFTRLVRGGSGAVPVIDLEMAGRERGLGAGWDRSFDLRHGAELSGACNDVVWASPNNSTRHLLFLAYTAAFEIWDCTDLKSLQQVLHMDNTHNPAGGANAEPESTGSLVCTAIVPESRRKGAKDLFRGNRPLIGDAVEFEANEEFIVVSMVDPATLSILSSTTLDTLRQPTRERAPASLSPSPDPQLPTLPTAPSCCTTLAQFLPSLIACILPFIPALIHTHPCQHGISIHLPAHPTCASIGRWQRTFGTSSDSSSTPRHTAISSQPPVNFQDILLFDPTDGMLSLWCRLPELRPRDRGTISIAALSRTSISLPGMGGAGKLSVSPSKSGAGRLGSGKSRLMEMMDVPMEMVEHESIVATWNLKMWGEKSKVRKPLQNREGGQDRVKEKTRRADWLAQAELSSFSRSAKLLPRTFSSLFDEPLASALAGGLDYHHSSGILPMLPNGMLGTQSFRSSIPIRMMTGLGDGEDEDFMRRDTLDILDHDGGSGSRGTSRGGVNSAASPSVSTPATSTHPLDDKDITGSKMDDEPDIWNGWSGEDKAAVEEAEQFDNVSVVGFLDEEQEQESRRMLEPKHTSVLAEKPNIKRKGRGRWWEI
ncbi:hypothetical protein L208DRAFT_1378399 [Tricholoma matsutake]|nr:hypothetical protein L208DRAFT_1378399 [Tricholoma matsutake 945]